LKSPSEVKARASKLRDILIVMGHQLKHTESLEVISKIDGFTDWNTYTAHLTRKLQTSDRDLDDKNTWKADTALLALAEEILDEMIEAESTDDGDYELFTKHMDNVDDFGPSRFKKELMMIREDYGNYKSRVYLGSLKGHVNPDNPNKYPGLVRFNWRGIFEKNETLITLGLYERDGKHVVKEIMYR